MYCLFYQVAGIFWLLYFVDGFTILSATLVIFLQKELLDDSNSESVKIISIILVAYCIGGVLLTLLTRKLIM